MNRPDTEDDAKARALDAATPAVSTVSGSIVVSNGTSSRQYEGSAHTHQPA